MEPGYEYIREIASGGYGYVYLFSRQQGDQLQYVAGKFIYRHVFGPLEDPSSAAAYERAFEGLQNFRSLSADSPYLLKIFDVRQRHEEGYFCYMMELADDLQTGRIILPAEYRPHTLKNELERDGTRKRLPARQCLRMAIQLARGLDVLHASGFTHRDVRPSNIIFVDDVPKLADIDLLADADQTLASYIPKDYAAPEGVHAVAADLFSFGKTLYEMCTGLPVKSFPCLPRDVREWEDHRLFLRLNEVMARACASHVRRRYRSAKEMLRDLDGVGSYKS
jgi:eukaryotic-like serine/threonine-protein kinase